MRPPSPRRFADLARDALDCPARAPNRHDVFRWTDAEREEELRQLARSIEACINNPKRLEQWRAWQQRSLYGLDPFYDAPVFPFLDTPPAPPIQLVIYHADTAAPTSGLSQRRAPIPIREHKNGGAGKGAGAGSNAAPPAVGGGGLGGTEQKL